MALQLPHAVDRRLRQTLAQWRQWQCDPPLARAPGASGLLGSGQSNFSVLAAQGDRAFVVRIDGVDPATHGINRHAEWRALQSGCRATLSPCPRYFNPQLGSLVYDYLPADPSQPDRPKDIAALLRAIHQLPPRRHRLDLPERLNRYERLVQHKALPEGLFDTGARVRQLLAGNLTDAPLTLCHNDLLRANRLYSGGRLIALDWEYCAMCDPWYDLAVVVHGDALDEPAADRLAAAYLRREPSVRERQRLHALGCVYRYLALLWYLATGREVRATLSARRQLGELRQLLDRG